MSEPKPKPKPIKKDPVVNKLAKGLGLPYPFAAGIRATLRFLAEEFYPIGAIQHMSAQEIADAIDWHDNASTLVTQLLACGLLAKDAGGYTIPDWVESDPEWLRFSAWVRATDGEGDHEHL